MQSNTLTTNWISGIILQLAAIQRERNMCLHEGTILQHSLSIEPFKQTTQTSDSNVLNSSLHMLLLATTRQWHIVPFLPLFPPQATEYCPIFL